MLSASNLSELWASNLSNNSDLPALDSMSNTWTYKEFTKQSDLIAAKLISLGIKNGNVIAIIHTKEFYFYAAMLACIRYGFIYTNIDPNSPPERTIKILNTCSAKIILHNNSLSVKQKTDIQGLGYPTLLIETIDESQKLSTLMQAPNSLTWHSPAYIMFTSGSTGFPKGVTITHGGILSFISWSIKYYGVKKTDRFAQLSPMYFDNSVFDFYTALFAGATIIPIEQNVINNPKQLVQYVEKMSCTIWFSVPTLLIYLLTVKVLTAESLPTIRIFTFGGEGFPKGELKKIYSFFKHRAKLINVYGPTEGTCICSAYEISDVDFTEMKTLAPIGNINPNFYYLIVDENLKRVEKGQKGELCLGGPNISPGYFNDNQRTIKQFIQNPEINQYRDIIYKTGDIVYEQDNKLWFAGRLDNQIKHMGYRIELEEIEAAINSIEHVEQCIVTYEKNNDKYGSIKCYIQSSLNAKINHKIINEELSKKIPNYMIPNEIIFIDKLPKNSNGKVDRNKLKINSSI